MRAVALLIVRRLYRLGEWVFTLTTHWTKKWCLEKCSLRIPTQWRLVFTTGWAEASNILHSRGVSVVCLCPLKGSLNYHISLQERYRLMQMQSKCTWLPHWLVDDNVDIQTKCLSQSQHSDCPVVESLMVTRLSLCLYPWLRIITALGFKSTEFTI